MWDIPSGNRLLFIKKNVEILKKSQDIFIFVLISVISVQVRIITAFFKIPLRILTVKCQLSFIRYCYSGQSRWLFWALQRVLIINILSTPFFVLIYFCD